MSPAGSLTARAVIALALMAGFYALALLMVALLLWLPYASVVCLRLNALTGTAGGHPRPFADLRRNLIGPGADRWRRLCDQAGIADVDLGAGRDALYGR